MLYMPLNIEKYKHYTCVCGKSFKVKKKSFLSGNESNILCPTCGNSNFIQSKKNKLMDMIDNIKGSIISS